jgi:hypothetical protein
MGRREPYIRRPKEGPGAGLGRDRPDTKAMKHWWQDGIADYLDAESKSELARSLEQRSGDIDHSICRTGVSLLIPRSPTTTTSLLDRSLTSEGISLLP